MTAAPAVMFVRTTVTSEPLKAAPGKYHWVRPFLQKHSHRFKHTMLSSTIGYAGNLAQCVHDITALLMVLQGLKHAGHGDASSQVMCVCVIRMAGIKIDPSPNAAYRKC